MNEQTPVNQTQFSFEEPIFENTQVYVDESQPILPQTPKNKKKFIFIGIGLFFLVLVVLTIVLIIRGNSVAQDGETQIKETKTTIELGPIEQRIEDARVLLNTADPTKQDLSFPPVDLNLRLDKKEDR